MILASVTKTFSLFYSLAILGADETFKTRLFIEGDVKNGILKGDVILKGGGDPYLSPGQLMSMVQALKVKGIEKVDGRFIYDQSLLLPTSKLSSIGLEDQPDNPAIGALNVDFNRFRIFKSTTPLPPLTHLGVDSTKADLPKGLGFSYESKKSKWIKSKSTKAKKLIPLPSRDAGLFTANYFKYLAHIVSIELPSPIDGKTPSTATPSTATLINTHESLPLWRLASQAIEYSNNLFAELPSMMAARKELNKPVGVRDTATAMHLFLKKNFPKIDFKSAQFVNSSGLTIDNKISAKATAMFLNEIKDKQFNGRSFWTQLSINGRSGWLAKRLMEPRYAYRIWAKTGSLYYVSNIAGYYLNKKGQRVAFAIFVTDAHKRALLNTPLTEKAYHTRKSSKVWARNSKRLIDKLLLSWLN